ncbi:MAG: thioredoxin family protein [Planctomycetes bacterium]|nr:thioredoxin family protein [Planctomycetota bacterium]
MKTLTLTLLSIVALALPSLAQDDIHKQWFADYDKAVAAATAAKKDLLVDFTGSDWCGWCIKLDKEVFAHEAFLSAASEKFILVALDFPRGDEAKAKVPNPDRNQELSQKYGVQGFPSILLITPQGEVYGKTGYQEGGPEAYVKHLEEISASGKLELSKAKEFAAEYAAAADEAAKLAIIERALIRLSSMDPEGIGAATYADVARNAYILDAKDERGLATRTVSTLLELGLTNQADKALVGALDPKNEKGLLEKLVMAKTESIASKDELENIVAEVEALMAMGPIKDKDLAKMFVANLAFWNHRFLGNPAKAKTYAKQLQELAGEDPGYAKRFGDLVTMILAADDTNDEDGGDQ